MTIHAGTGIHLVPATVEPDEQASEFVDLDSPLTDSEKIDLILTEMQTIRGIFEQIQTQVQPTIDKISGGMIGKVLGL